MKYRSSWFDFPLITLSLNTKKVIISSAFTKFFFSHIECLNIFGKCKEGLTELRPRIISCFHLSGWWKKNPNQKAGKKISPIFSCSCTIYSSILPFNSIHYAYLKWFSYIKTSSCYILKVCNISKTPSKVSLITTFHIFQFLNQGRI